MSTKFADYVTGWAPVFSPPGPHALLVGTVNLYSAIPGLQIELRFPSAPVDRDEVVIVDFGGEWGLVFLSTLGGHTIQAPGSTGTGSLLGSGFIFRAPGMRIRYKFESTSGRWLIIDERLGSTGPGGFLFGHSGFSEAEAAYKDAINGGTVAKAKADAAATASFVGAYTGMTSGSGLFKLDGQFYVPAGALQENSPWIEGDRIYLSAATAGAYTNTPPVLTGQFVVLVGRVILQQVGFGAVVQIERGEVTEIT